MKTIRAWGARLFLGVLVAFAVVLVSENAHAYAWMIRHEYAGCAQCHADPSGGGLLTLYGRAQSELLLRTRYKKSKDEDPGKVGNFLFGAFDLPESILLGGDARSLILNMSPAPPAPAPATRFILMQADLEGQVSVGAFRANGSLGYNYTGALGASVTRGGADSPRLVSRVHWVGVDLGEDKQFTIRAGRMNLPYGLRHIEHTMFVRTATRTDINAAQQHGVALAYNGGFLRGEAMGILGNFQERPDDVRDRGFSAFVELTPMEKLAFGASGLIVHSASDLVLSTPLWRHAYGLFGRYSPWTPLVLLAEFDMLLNSQPAYLAGTHRTQFGTAGMLQADLEPIQGVHVIGTSELLDQELARGGPTYGLWGGVHWFFAPHADLRLDAVHYIPPGTANGSTYLLAQIHAFL